jgi:hypothetical protein
LQVQGQPGLHSETLSPKNKTKQNPLYLQKQTCTIAKSKLPVDGGVNEWIHTMRSSHKVEYHAALKREGNSDTGYNVDEP